MKILCLFLFFLLHILLCFCSDEIFYISVNSGNTTNNCLSSQEPCKTLEQAILLISNETTSLTLNIFPGIYTGNENIYVNFPNISITIQRYTDNNNNNNDVIFDCQELFPSIFYSKSSLYINNISLNSCNQGIIFNPDNNQYSNELVLLNSEIYNCSTGIYFESGSFIFNNSMINSTNIGIHITSIISFNSNNIEIYNSFEYSILLDYSKDIDIISISNSTFMNTAGIIARVGDNTPGNILNCLFLNIISDTVIGIDEGLWHLTNITINSNNSLLGTYYHSLNSNGLYISDSIIETGDSGIHFNGSELFISSSSISSNFTCINIERANTIGLTNSIELSQCFANALYFNYTDNPVSIDINGITLYDAAGFYFNVAQSSSASVYNVNVYLLLTQVFDITGGSWDFINILINGYIPIFNSNGGLIKIQGTGDGSDQIISFTSCTFTAGYTSLNGGAIYANNLVLSIEDSLFHNNIAQDNGGAIYFENIYEFSIKNSTFTYNSGTNGGSIELTNPKGGVNVYLDTVNFSNNDASNGAAIDCCSSTSCTITLVYDSDDTVELINNRNTVGDSDITCDITEGTFETAGDNNDNDDSSIDDWIIWVSVSAGILLLIIIVIVIIVLVYIVIRKKRSEYDVISENY